MQNNLGIVLSNIVILCGCWLTGDSNFFLLYDSKPTNFLDSLVFVTNHDFPPYVMFGYWMRMDGGIVLNSA